MSSMIKELINSQNNAALQILDLGKGIYIYFKFSIDLELYKKEYEKVNLEEN